MKKMDKQQMLFSALDLRKLIGPLMVEQALALTIGMFDTMLIANVGESAVAGVALVDTINVLLLNLFAALATGGAIVAGQYIGAKQKKEASLAAEQLLIVSVILSLIIMVPCLLFGEQILGFVFGDIAPDVMANAKLYFFVVSFSYPFIAIFNAAAALFRGMGNSKISMHNALGMNIMNVLFDIFLIFGLGLGVLGTALGTLFARIIGASIMLYRLRNPELQLSVRRIHLKDFHLSMVKRILRIGIPSGIENSIFQIGRIIMTTLVVSFGTSAITAHAVGTSLTGIEVIPGQALGMAVMIVVAQCVGAKEIEQAKYYTRYLMKWAYGSLIVLNLLMLLAIQPIISFYHLTPETAQLAYQIMLIHGIGTMVVWPLSFTLPNAFRAAGDVKYAMYVSIGSMFVFRIGSSFLLARFFDIGVLSVWFGMTIDWTFRSGCFLWRWFSNRWYKKAIPVEKPLFQGQKI